uniref:Putative non-ribosomal peptide synthetase n=1 Tax=uncultured bacterium RM35 TaxID=672207 RepID=D3W8L3_9BACT|nr:putative non-ribosomal peptide synthetase [uncultured bacterium RM35]
MWTPLPLSEGQRSLWLAQELAGDVPVYTLPLVFRVTGPLSEAAIRRSMEAVLERRDALRLVVRPDNEGLVQSLADVSAVDFGVTDGSSWDEPTAAAWLQAEAARPFDLRAGALRVRALRRAPDQWQILFAFHHIVCDGWSAMIVAAEFAELCAADVEGRAATLTPISRGFRDYLVWHRDLLASDDASALVREWAAMVGDLDVSTPLDLPTDLPRRAQQRYHVRQHFRDLGADLMDRVRESARAEGVTTYTVLLAAYQVLLTRLSSQRPFLVGCGVSGRTRTWQLGVVGHMAGIVPVPARIDAAATPRAIIRELRNALRVTAKLQSVPLSRLAEQCRVPKSPGRMPLVQAVFQEIRSFNEAIRPEGFGHMLRWSRGPLGFEVEVPSELGSQLDLEVRCYDFFSSSVRTCWRYDPDLFLPETVERWADYYAALLRELVGDLGRLALQIDFIPEPERRRVLVEWNQTASDYPRERCLHHLFEEEARRVPDAVALDAGSNVVSYGELNRRADKLAHMLRLKGVGTETRVGLCLERSVELVVGILGVLKAGGAYVPLDPAYPSERLAFLAHDAGVQIVLSAAGAEERLGEGPWTVVRLDEDLGRPDERDAAPNDNVSAENLAYVMYTSGSTGKPKGVAVTHRNVVRLVRGSSFATFGPDQVFLMMAPAAFDASTFEIWGALLHGARLVLFPPESPTPEEIGRVVREHGVTTLWLTAPLFHAVADRGLDQLRGVRQLLAGGDVLSPKHVARVLLGLPALRLINGYGPTENTTFTTCHDVSRGMGTGSVPIGKPIANTHVYLLDEQMNPVPPNAVGELFTGGDGLARGYHERPDQTAERFVPDPFSGVPGARLYRTGDLARYLPNGDMEFLGRRDGQVKIRGFRIELAEVEAALLQHPALREAVVIAREDRPGDKRLVAYVVGREAEVPRFSELRKFLLQRLPDHMIPAAVVALDKLPLVPSGKLDRRALPAPTLSGRSGPFVAPEGHPEEVLARIWERVLRVDAVGREDNFFELGGDSILAIQVVAGAREVDLKLTVRQIFTHPTLSSLAAAAQATAVSGEDQGEITGEMPLTPIQRWFLSGEPAAPHHFNQAVLLALRDAWVPKHVDAAVGAVIRHHDALRLRFVAEDGMWRARGMPSGGPVPYEVVDLSELPGEERRAALEARAAEAQASLDLTDGPILRVVQFRLGPGEPDRLLVVVHHLAVDVVSWGILLADLATAHRQLVEGEIVRLPSKTTSLRRWGERLLATVDEVVAAELPFWEALDGQGVRPLPRGCEPAEDREGDAQTVEVWLGGPETEALLGRVGEAYRTRADEVILAALAGALTEWAGGEAAYVAVEGHGREELFPDIEVARTVGWFTTIHPVVLPGRPQSAGARLKAVKEAIRRVPKHGIGYGILRYLGSDEVVTRLARLPAPEVAFNYLGRLDRALPKDGPFVMAPEAAGPSVSPRGKRSHALQTMVVAEPQGLRTRFAFQPKRHSHEEIARLAARYGQLLEELIAHAIDVGSEASWTPSDFPLARLEPHVLDALVDADRARPLDDLYPLTPLQEGILFHALLEPGGSHYCVQLDLALEGALDFDRLQQAWDETLGAHPALRASFLWEGVPEPLQVVRRLVRIPTERIDARSMAVDGDAWIVERARDERRRGFALDAAPAMRLLLVRTGDRSHRLIWTFHHILLDGWSVPLVLEEVFKRYSGGMQHEAAHRTAPRPHRDYVAWLRGADAQSVERFWRRELGGFREVTPLGIDRPPAGQRASSYRRFERALDEHTTARLEQVLRERQLTIGTLIAGAWAILLERYGGRRDVVFGETVSGRSAPLEGIERMVGLFINTVPMRAVVDPERPIGEWLTELQGRRAERTAYEHASLAQVQAWSEVPHGSALFESLIVVENYPVAPAFSGDELSVRLVGGDEQTNYPVTLVALPGRRLTLRLLYEAERIPDGAAEGVLSHLESLLCAIADDPDLPTGDLPLLSAHERRQVVADWNDTARAYARERCIHELFESSVERSPGSVALCYDGVPPLTYSDLNGRANRLGWLLRGLGAGPEERVVVWMDRAPELVVALLGILKTGGAYVPLDPRWPLERVAAVLGTTRPVCIVTDERHLGAVEIAARQLGIEHVVSLDGDGKDADGNVVIHGRRALADLADGNLPRAAGPHNMAYVIFTSGSTGTPKGVVERHSQVINLIEWVNRTYLVGPSDRLLFVTSPSFDLSVYDVFGMLAAGGSIHIASEDDLRSPERLAAELGRGTITFWDSAPAALQQLVPYFDRIEDGSQLRLAFLSGDWVPIGMLDELRRAFPNVKLVGLGGATEATVWSNYFEVDGIDPRWTSIPYGRPIQNARYYVLDRSGNPCPIGVTGDLYIGGTCVSFGYYADPSQTAERFVPDPFSGEPGARLYRTGDLARFFRDGNIEFLGRADSQVKIRGYRIECGEVEVALAQHPGAQRGRGSGGPEGRAATRRVRGRRGGARVDRREAEHRVITGGDRRPLHDRRIRATPRGALVGPFSDRGVRRRALPSA